MIIVTGAAGFIGSGIIKALNEHGEQQRDFVYVDDVVRVNLWFYDHPDKYGIFNVSTGHAQSFNDVAHAIINWHGHGKIKYIPFPEHLRGYYQSFTQANINKLRVMGYQEKFMSVEEGVKHYLDTIEYD